MDARTKPARNRTAFALTQRLGISTEIAAAQKILRRDLARRQPFVAIK
jgi:hypothetical protein